jgi:hypothetical protein
MINYKKLAYRLDLCLFYLLRYLKNNVYALHKKPKKKIFYVLLKYLSKL